MGNVKDNQLSNIGLIEKKCVNLIRNNLYKNQNIVNEKNYFLVISLI